MPGDDARDTPRGQRNPTRQVGGGCAEARQVISRIAAEELVRPLAGEDDRNVVAGVPAQEVQRHGVRVTERLVVIPDETAQHLREPLATCDEHVVLSAEPGSRFARQGRFVPGGVVKPDGEGV
jgi:hypothetical protein